MGYLIACLFYVPFRKNQFALLSGMVLLYCFYLAIESGMLIQISFLGDLRQVGAMLGSLAAIVLSGVILGNKLRENIENPNHNNILQWAFGFSSFLFIAGMLLHQLNDIHIMFIIDKDNGTVPWCLISSALTIWIWMLIYWLVDMKKLRKWTTIIEPAGTNPLFAYILAPFVGECLILISYIFGGFNFYDWLGQSFYTGFFRSIIFSVSMTWLAGYLSKRGIKLGV